MFADTLSALTIVLGSVAIGALVEWVYVVLHDRRNGDD